MKRHPVISGGHTWPGAPTLLINITLMRSSLVRAELAPRRLVRNRQVIVNSWRTTAVGLAVDELNAAG